jgi:predicted nucleotidyltransferase
VRIRYLDRETVRKALDDLVKVLAEEHPELEAVILLGSFARGDAVPASDVDLLLILADSELPFHHRIPAFLPSRFPVSVDVFPYTRQEIEKMLREGNPFISSALEKGVELFRRPIPRG